jgi:hypothetical protein
MERNRILKLLGVASITSIIAIFYFGKSLGIDHTDKILALILCMASYIVIWLVSEVAGLVKEPAQIGPKKPWYKNSLLPWNWPWSDFFQATGLYKLWPANWQWPKTLKNNFTNMKGKTIMNLALIGLAIGVTALAYLQWGAKYAVGVFVALILLGIIVSFGSKLASYLWSMFKGTNNNQNNGNNNSQTNVDDAELGCLEFPDDEHRGLYEFAVRIELWTLPVLIMLGGVILSFMASFWFLLIAIAGSFISYFWYESKMVSENSVKEILLMTIFGKPVAFARKGGPYIRPLYLAKVSSENNEIIEINFGKEYAVRAGERARGDELSIGCASITIAELFENEFVNTFDSAGYKPIKGTSVDGSGNLVIEYETGAEALKKAKADKLNHMQTHFKSELNIVLQIDIFPKNSSGGDDLDTAFKNVVNYFKNIPGENKEQRLRFFKDQLRENVRSQLNTQYKKYTYSMLLILMTTDALDNVLKLQINKMIKNQSLGLIPISVKLTALGAEQAVHTAQNDFSLAKFTAETGIIAAEGVKAATVIKAGGEAKSTEIKAAAEKVRKELEGQGDAAAYRSLGDEEINVLKGMLDMVKAQFPGDDAMMRELVRLEYELENQKILPSIKGPVIIKSSGGGSDGNDNTVQTVLLKKAIDELAEIIKNKA